jgi:hypothetical protein
MIWKNPAILLRVGFCEEMIHLFSIFGAEVRVLLESNWCPDGEFVGTQILDITTSELALNPEDQNPRSFHEKSY